MNNTSPESNLDLDLHFLPAWAQPQAQSNPFAEYEGESTERDDRRGGRGRSDGRRREGPRRDGPGDSRRPGGGPGPRRSQQDGPRPGGDRGDRRRGPGPDRRDPPRMLPEVEVNIFPEEHGVENLAKKIKMTGRAYPLFDIGHLILKKPERYNVRFNVIKKPEGEVVQALFLCSIDQTLWFSQAEAIDHIFSKHFNIFYQEEKIPADPPKGVFTFVAQCGMSGIVLGPPNYHDYQTKLRRLHSERYSYLPFEAYKSRVRIVKDEAIVNKWKEEQSFSTQYLCLNIPDALKLSNREEVDRHFRETHLPNVVQSVDSFVMNGGIVQSQPNGILKSLTRRAFEEQRRFPLKLVTVLSQMFASHGLQFFKVHKSVTHVATSRPHFLDMATTPVSDGVKKIVNLIDATPGCTRRQLLDVLAPAPQGAVPVAAPVPAATSPEAAVVAASEGVPAVPAPAGETPVVSPESQVITPAMNIVISDLHWLIHQGHVIEFANGTLETAKRPLPRPPKPVRTGEAAPAIAGTAETPATPAQIAEAVIAEATAEESPAAEAPSQPAEPVPPAEPPVA